MALLSGVFLRDLQFDRFVGAAQPGEQRRRRFAHLEIDRTILDLDDDVVVERAVERMKIVVGRFRAIVFQIVPIEMVVVDEGAIEHDAAMRLEGAGDHVGGVGRRSAIGRGPEAALGIGLHDEAAEIRDVPVNLVHLLAPPLGDPRIQRIKRVEPADDFGAAEIDGQRKLHAPGTEHIGDAADLRDETVFENAGGGVHVIDRASVDADRGQQASVLAGAGQIAADVSIGEEDGRAAVSALDAAVEIVPLVHPADGSVGLLYFIDSRNIEGSDILRARDLA